MSYNKNDPTNFFGVFKGKRITVPNQNFYKWTNTQSGDVINTITTTDYAKNEMGEYVTYSIPYRLVFFSKRPFTQGESVVVNSIRSVKFESYNAQNGKVYSSIKVVCEIVSLEEYNLNQQNQQNQPSQYAQKQPNQYVPQQNQYVPNNQTFDVNPDSQFQGEGYNDMVSSGNEPNEYNI